MYFSPNRRFVRHDPNAPAACYLYEAQSTVPLIRREHTLLKKLHRLALTVILCLGACSSTTTFIATWKSPDAQRVNLAGKKIAALVLSKDRDRRRSAEVYLANDITNRGAQGIAAYTLIGLDNPAVDYARARFKEAGVEGVVIMRLISADQQTIVDPGGFSGSAYGTFGNYYSSYGVSLSYSTGYEYTDMQVSIETLIYSLNKDKLMWAGTSRTSNPEGLASLVTEVADSVANELRKQGLIAR